MQQVHAQEHLSDGPEEHAPILAHAVRPRHLIYWVMNDLVVTVDISGARELVRDLQEFEAEVQEKVGDLASQTHLHIKEQVQQRLNTRRDMYDQALSSVQEVGPGVYVIKLDASAVWIEEGMPQHSMVDDLLRGPNVRTAKDGSRFRVIPFDQSKGGGRTATAGQSMLNTALRQELRKRNIPYKNIERHPDGSPKTGLLHKFNMDQPLRPGGTAGKPGFGKGPEGEVMQGPNAAGGSGGGIPLLQGVRIYQNALFKRAPNGDMVPNTNKQGLQRATRGIMTFRVVSSKHKGLKWNYPGIEGTHLFEEAEQWAGSEWTNHILPDILRRLGS